MYLCLALGFQGQLPARAARPGRARPRARGALRHHHRASARRGRTRAVAALARAWRRRTARPAARRAGLGDGTAAARAARRAVRVVLDRARTPRPTSLCAQLQARAACAHMPQIARAAPVRPPPPPPPPPEPPRPDPLDKLRQFLAPEIDAGPGHRRWATAPTPLVRIRNRGMFASGSATVKPRFLPLLDRIGEALKDGAGPVRSSATPTTSRSAPCSSRPTSSSPPRAPRRHALAIAARPGRSRRGSPPRAAPTPSRWPTTPPPRAASRTAASRSCCGRADDAARDCLPVSRWILSSFVGARCSPSWSGSSARCWPAWRTGSHRGRDHRRCGRCWSGRVVNFLLDRRRSEERDAALVEGVAAAGRRPVEAAAAEEGAALREQADHRAGDAAQAGARQRAATCTSSPGTSSSARRARARPPRC